MRDTECKRLGYDDTGRYHVPEATGDDIWPLERDTCCNEPCVSQTGNTEPAGNPLLESMRSTFADCHAIAVAKNAGYAGDADPMANFNDSTRLGVPVPIGIALRLSDKWARLTRLLRTGENPLADETVTDTIRDSINYLAILLYSLEREESLHIERPPTTP